LCLKNKFVDLEIYSKNNTDYILEIKIELFSQ